MILLFFLNIVSQIIYMPHRIWIHPCSNQNLLSVCHVTEYIFTNTRINEMNLILRNFFNTSEQFICRRLCSLHLTLSQYLLMSSLSVLLFIPVIIHRIDPKPLEIWSQHTLWAKSPATSPLPKHLFTPLIICSRQTKLLINNALIVSLLKFFFLLSASSFYNTV